MFMVAGINRAVMRYNNCFADRKTDAHAFVGVGFDAADIGRTVKNMGQPVLGNADTKIFYMKSNHFIIVFYIAQNRLCTL